MKVIPKNVLEELRARSDIVEVVGGYLRLQRAGASFKALCPFHKEKTPSFHVNPARQTFHCFGCGAGGDVFRFVMQKEGVDFSTAVRLLARRAGMVIEVADEDPREKSEKDQLYRIHEDLAEFYRRVLQEHPAGEAARAYLKTRDLVEAARVFRFGFAPDVPDALLKFAAAKKYEPALLEKAGVLMRSEGRGGFYDRFRGRLMIPIRDELGRVIAFTGRVLRAEDSPAKYVNSPETPLFRKGRVLFAFDRARRAIAEQRRAILCEGQIDVIRCQLAGLENAVAAQGTAVTEDHARILRRYADEVVLMLDADTAGQNAALRSAELMLAAELSVRVAVLPAGEDPDSLIRKEGRAAIDRVLEGARPVVDYLIELSAARGELASEAGLGRAVTAVLDLAALSPSPTQRDFMLRAAAARLRLSETALREQLGRRRARPAANARAEEETRPAPPAHPPHELGALRSLIRHPELAPLFRTHLPERLFMDAVCARLYRLALAHPPEAWSAEVAAIADDDEIARVYAEAAALTGGGGEVYSPEDAARDYILAMWRGELQRRRERLLRQTDLTPEMEREINTLSWHLSLLRRGWDAALPFLELQAEE